MARHRFHFRTTKDVRTRRDVGTPHDVRKGKRPQAAALQKRVQPGWLLMASLGSSFSPGRLLVMTGKTTSAQYENLVGRSPAGRYPPLCMKAYEEVIDFIASGPSSSSIVSFRPSPEASERVGELIEREKTTGLSPEEKVELDHYMELEHIMRLAKARARQRLANEQPR